MVTFKKNSIASVINPFSSLPFSCGMSLIIKFSQASSDLGFVLGSPLNDVFTGAGF